MRDTEEMQRILYSEMVSRMPSKITTPPERWGPWFVISLHFDFLCSINSFPLYKFTPCYAISELSIIIFGVPVDNVLVDILV